MVCRQSFENDDGLIQSTKNSVADPELSQQLASICIYRILCEIIAKTEATTFCNNGLFRLIRATEKPT